MVSRADEARVERIEVWIRIGDSRMAASDDPVFLQIHGHAGREFRLAPPRGHGFRRGSDDRYVLAGPGVSDTNVAHPELNDPTAPEILLRDIQGVSLRKGQEPIPNVRGLGEMDDRLELIEAEVTIAGAQTGDGLRFVCKGPIWLGLVCGMRVELARVESDS